MTTTATADFWLRRAERETGDVMQALCSSRRTRRKVAARLTLTQTIGVCTPRKVPFIPAVAASTRTSALTRPRLVPRLGLAARSGVAGRAALDIGTDRRIARAEPGELEMSVSTPPPESTSRVSRRAAKALLRRAAQSSGRRLAAIVETAERASP